MKSNQWYTFGIIFLVISIIFYFTQLATTTQYKASLIGFGLSDPFSAILYLTSVVMGSFFYILVGLTIAFFICGWMGNKTKKR